MSMRICPLASLARGLTSELVTVRKCLLISVRSNINSSGAREDGGGTSSVWSPASAADFGSGRLAGVYSDDRRQLPVQRVV